MRTEAQARAAVIAEALTWERTEFMWEAAIKGTGVDCGRFLAASFNGAGVKKIDIAAFKRIPADWFMHKKDDAPSPFLEQIEQYAVRYELAKGQIPQPADLVVAKCGHDWAHSAIVIAWPKIIGAAFGHCVTVWRDIRRSPQFMNRQLVFLNPFDPKAGGNV